MQSSKLKKWNAEPVKGKARWWQVIYKRSDRPECARAHAANNLHIICKTKLWKRWKLPRWLECLITVGKFSLVCPGPPLWATSEPAWLQFYNSHSCYIQSCWKYTMEGFEPLIFCFQGGNNASSQYWFRDLNSAKHQLKTNHISAWACMRRQVTMERRNPLLTGTFYLKGMFQR